MAEPDSLADDGSRGDDDADGRPRRRAHVVPSGKAMWGRALMVVAGLAVQMNVLPLPMWTAYLLMGLGLLELFVVPRLLAGIWSSNDKLPPQP